MQKISIKEWFIDKEQTKAGNYNIWFNSERNADGSINRTNGYETVFAEVLEETEKAVKLHIESGDVLGSFKGWTVWVPKSVIA